MYIRWKSKRGKQIKFRAALIGLSFFGVGASVGVLTAPSPKTDAKPVNNTNTAANKQSQAAMSASSIKTAGDKQAEAIKKAQESAGTDQQKQAAATSAAAAQAASQKSAVSSGSQKASASSSSSAKTVNATGEGSAADSTSSVQNNNSNANAKVTSSVATTTDLSSSPSNAAAETDATTAANTYTVQKGDSLWVISQKSNVNFQTLVDLNPEASSHVIYRGQVIRLH